MNQEIHTETPKSLYQNIDLFTVFFWGTVILAFCLRFYDLAGKPFHHDESLYSVYCWRFFKGEGYKYDPMMHGPFLFHFQVLLFFLFGVSDFSARIAPALFGSLMVVSIYYLRDYLGKIGVLTVALLFTVSPTQLYFSRFMREDIFVAFFIYASAIFGILYYRWRQKKYLYLTAASLALMFCEKENSYIHAFIFLTFLVLKDFYQTYLSKTATTMNAESIIGWVAACWILLSVIGLMAFYTTHPLPVWLSGINKETGVVYIIALLQVFLGVWVLRYFKNHLHAQLRADQADHTYPLIFAAGIFLWIYILLYTTFFTNPGGILDGLSKSWIYWWGQNKMQRIKGPFLYYVPFILLYELPVFLVAVGGVLYKIANTLNKRIIAGWAVVFSGFLMLFYGNRPLPPEFGFTHMEIWADLILTMLVLGIGLWATVYFLSQRETLAAFFVYWSAIGFLIYCYAGEKVPWLFLHVLLPVIPLAGIFLNQFFTARAWYERTHTFKIRRLAVIVIGALFGIYLLHTTVLLNYEHPANPVETMVYTQTSTDILKLLEVVRNVQFSIGSEEAKKPMIAVQGNAVWPMAWYLRDYEGWYYPEDFSKIRRPIMVTDWENHEKSRELLGEEYQEIQVKLREWWIPQPEATLSDWWRYFLYRRVFNPTGSSDIALYIKK